MTNFPSGVVKVLVFAASPLAGPSINMLAQQNKLAGVVLTEEVDAFSYQLENWLQEMQLPFLRFNSAQPDLLLQKLMLWEVNLAINFSFPQALPQQLLDMTAFYNFHPAPLPKYQGPMALYWQIRDGQTQTQLTLQKANVEKGEADIGATLDMPIHPLDTLQSLQGKVAQQVPQLLYQFIEELVQKGETLVPQQGERSQAAVVQEADLYVDWLTMTSEQICALARAGNAHLGGCIVKLGQTPINLLQATAVKHPTFGVNPGTICHIGEPQGVIVATKNGALRLDILSNADGVFSGLSFTDRFGVNAGMEFSSVGITNQYKCIYGG
ncbi:methionyl-tRNA formyltransferase [Motilimonas eburnea]|uniref:methionyl-tRNA formyltransferase n=1 Tax=Motilimonas eburnea TaxID=1737488 RepID=UPI001E2C4385|nr:formyltransferase family protein [Motilimonas eburnea]MCE2571197.1 methionyl-tRNA formyltransferase [Motilimonas eburnea]